MQKECSVRGRSQAFHSLTLQKGKPVFAFVPVVRVALPVSGSLYAMPCRYASAYGESTSPVLHLKFACPKEWLPKASTKPATETHVSANLNKRKPISSSIATQPRAAPSPLLTFLRPLLQPRPYDPGKDFNKGNRLSGTDGYLEKCSCHVEDYEDKGQCSVSTLHGADGVEENQMPRDHQEKQHAGRPGIQICKRRRRDLRRQRHRDHCSEASSHGSVQHGTCWEAFMQLQLFRTSRTPVLQQPLGKFRQPRSSW